MARLVSSSSALPIHSPSSGGVPEGCTAWVPCKNQHFATPAKQSKLPRMHLLMKFHRCNSLRLVHVINIL